MMKKSILLLSLLFTVILSSKAQLIIHGSSSTTFYDWGPSGTSLSILISGEIWVVDPNPSVSPTGFVTGQNLVWNSVTNYGAAVVTELGGNAGEIAITCEEASNRWNKGDCGPKSYVTTWDANGNAISNPKCWNGNSYGCSVVTSAGVTIYAKDSFGNF